MFYDGIRNPADSSGNQKFVDGLFIISKRVTGGLGSIPKKKVNLLIKYWKDQPGTCFIRAAEYCVRTKQ